MSRRSGDKSVSKRFTSAEFQYLTPLKWDTFNRYIEELSSTPPAINDNITQTLSSVNNASADNLCTPHVIKANRLSSGTFALVLDDSIQVILFFSL